jgi:kynurenine formamidase
MTTGRTLLAATLLVGGCASAPDVGAVFDGRAGTWIDLSYSFSNETIYWPTASTFELEVVSFEETDAGYFYAANNFSAAEHGGTHLDAPIHFSEGRWTTDKIPLDRLMGPAVVITVNSGAAPDYLVTVDDLEEWEGRHGSIPDGAIVLLQLGLPLPRSIGLSGNRSSGSGGGSRTPLPGPAP